MSKLLSGITSFDFAGIFSNVLTRWYYYVALLVVLVGFLLFFLLKKKSKRHNLSKTQTLVYAAILTSLCAVANMVTWWVYIPARCAVSFVAIPCFIAGYLLGAKEGFVVGFVGDLIQCIILPAGAYIPLIGIATGLWGFIPGIIFDNFRGKTIVKTIISFAICFVVCSCCLTTLGNWLYVVLDMNSTTTFWVYLGARAWFQAVVCVANCIICVSLALIFKKVLPKDRFNL